MNGLIRLQMHMRNSSFTLIVYFVTFTVFLLLLFSLH